MSTGFSVRVTLEENRMVIKDNHRELYSGPPTQHILSHQRKGSVCWFARRDSRGILQVCYPL